MILLTILTLLAVARAARLVTVDKITEPVRNWIAGVVLDDDGYYADDPKRPKLLYFLTCPWCTSIWIGAVAAGLVAWQGDERFVFWLMLLGAASEVAGFMAMFEERLDRDCCVTRDEP